MKKIIGEMRFVKLFFALALVIVALLQVKTVVYAESEKSIYERYLKQHCNDYDAYTLIDLDQDGTKELLVREIYNPSEKTYVFNSCLSIYCLKDGKVRFLDTISDSYDDYIYSPKSKKLIRTWFSMGTDFQYAYYKEGEKLKYKLAYHVYGKKDKFYVGDKKVSKKKYKNQLEKWKKDSYVIKFKPIANLYSERYYSATFNKKGIKKKTQYKDDREGLITNLSFDGKKIKIKGALSQTGSREDFCVKYHKYKTRTYKIDKNTKYYIMWERVGKKEFYKKVKRLNKGEIICWLNMTTKNGKIKRINLFT